MGTIITEESLISLGFRKEPYDDDCEGDGYYMLQIADDTVVCDLALIAHGDDCGRYYTYLFPYDSITIDTVEDVEKLLSVIKK